MCWLRSSSRATYSANAAVVTRLVRNATVPNATITTVIRVMSRRKRKLCSIVVPHELVSDSVHGLDEDRLDDVRFDLSAQVHDMDIDSALQAIIIEAEHALKQFHTGERPA